jgi:hypothetical protein
MKKTIKLKCAAFCTALLSPFLFQASSLGSLKEVAKPYLGVYECKEIYLGNEDKTLSYDYVRMELKPKGELLLTYREKDGRKGESKARYTYDINKDELTIYAEFGGKEYGKTFPVKDGKIAVAVRYGDKILKMQFDRK